MNGKDKLTEKAINRIKLDFIAETNACKALGNLNYIVKSIEQNLKTKSNEQKNTFKRIYTEYTKFKSKHVLNDFVTGVQSKLSPEQIKLVESKPEPRKIPKKKDYVLDELIAFYDEYLDKIDNNEVKAEMIEFWQKNQVLGHPINAKSGVEYQGGNYVLLSMIQEKLGLDLPYFLSETNIKEIGEDVPEKPIAIIKKKINLYVNDSLKPDDKMKWLTYTKYNDLDESLQIKYKKVNCIKYFPTYHSSQFDDNLKDNPCFKRWTENRTEAKILKKLSESKTDAEKKAVFDPYVDSAKKYVLTALKNMRVNVLPHNSKCFYNPAEDYICMVNEEHFNSSVGYLSVLCHEASHSTGSESRINRTFGKFGDSDYSKEELIAESSSTYLLRNFHLEKIPSQSDEAHLYYVESAKYIRSWLKTQSESNKKDVLADACFQGKKAAEFIIDAAGSKPEVILKTEDTLKIKSKQKNQ